MEGGQWKFVFVTYMMIYVAHPTGLSIGRLIRYHIKQLCKVV